MIDLYEIADPGQSKGESITAREVLDNSLLAASETPASRQLLADQERAVGLVLLRQRLDRLLSCCPERSKKIERTRRESSRPLLEKALLTEGGSGGRRQRNIRSVPGVGMNVAP